MPIEKKPGETKDEFIARCMSVETKKYDNKQAYAICISTWNRK